MEKQTVESHIRQLQAHFFGQRYAGSQLANIRLLTRDSDKIGNWVKEKKGILVISGPPGVGKTHLCAALVHWMHSKVGDIYAIKESVFLERVRASFDMKGDYHREIEYQCDHQLFIFDDLGSTGKGSSSGWRQEVLFEVINLRYESGLPTIFTTNYTSSDVKSNIGERAASRFYSSENTLIPMWDYPDLREPEYMQKGKEGIKSDQLRPVNI